MATRLYQDAELKSGETLLLDAQASTHLLRVLRLQAGDHCQIFDGRGHEHQATLDGQQGKQARILIGPALNATPASPLNLQLIQGLSKGQRMDTAIQKAVELGVNAIWPSSTERSVVRLDNKRKANKHQHWQAIIQHACEQSARADLPQLQPIQSLSETLKHPDHHRLIALHPDGQDQLPAQHPTNLSLVIGPEGGLSDNDLDQLKTQQALVIPCGPRILRTETAAIVGLTLLQSRYGDLP